MPMTGYTYDAAPVRIFSDHRQFDRSQNAFLGTSNARTYVNSGGNAAKSEQITSKMPRGKDGVTGQTLIIDQTERLMPYNNPHYEHTRSNHYFIPETHLHTQGNNSWLRR